MTSPQVALKTSKRGRRKQEAGQISLTEAMVAGVASTLIVGATALSMQSTAKIINTSTDKATPAEHGEWNALDANGGGAGASSDSSQCQSVSRR